MHADNLTHKIWRKYRTADRHWGICSQEPLVTYHIITMDRTRNMVSKSGME